MPNIHPAVQVTDDARVVIQTPFAWNKFRDGILSITIGCRPETTEKRCFTDVNMNIFLTLFFPDTSVRCSSQARMVEIGVNPSPIEGFESKSILLELPR